MSHRCLSLFAMITVMLLALVPVAGQSPSATGATPPELRGPDGKPNLVTALSARAGWVPILL